MKKAAFPVISKIITWALSALAITLLIYSVYVIQDMLYVQRSAFQTLDIAQYKPVIIEDEETPLSNVTSVASVNEDYRAWITMYGTNIDYPVMQGENDIYYASHDIYKKSSFSGAIYLAKDCAPDYSDNYNIMFGHHMDNGAMFGDLDKYKDEEFFLENRTGMLVSKGGTIYELTTFAVLETDAYDEMVYAAGNRDYEEIFAYLNEKAKYYDEEEAKKATKIVILSTCADATTNGRLVVYCSMTERDDIVVIEDDGSIEKPEIIEDEGPPLAKQPDIDGVRKWALLNLLCMIATIYLLLPLLHIRHKYRRKKLFKAITEDESFLDFTVPLEDENETDASSSPQNENAETENEENEYVKYQKKFKRRFIIGIIVEIILAIAAVIAFILTEDMRLKMQIIDEWTPLMLIILGVTWVIDIIFISFKKKILKMLMGESETMNTIYEMAEKLSTKKTV